MALLLRTWTFSRFFLPHPPFTALTVAMWIEGENGKKWERKFSCSSQTRKIFNKATLIESMRENRVREQQQQPPRFKNNVCVCFAGIILDIFIHNALSFFMDMIHGKLFAVKKYISPNYHPPPTCVLNFVIFTSHSLIMDTAAATYSNTHHHFAIQCTFSFCEFSSPSPSIQCWTVIIIIISLPQKKISRMSLFHSLAFLPSVYYKLLRRLVADS